MYSFSYQIQIIVSEIMVFEKSTRLGQKLGSVFRPCCRGGSQQHVKFTVTSKLKSFIGTCRSYNPGGHKKQCHFCRPSSGCTAVCPESCRSFPQSRKPHWCRLIDPGNIHHWMYMQKTGVSFGAWLILRRRQMYF